MQIEELPAEPEREVPPEEAALTGGSMKMEGEASSLLGPKADTITPIVGIPNPPLKRKKEMFQYPDFKCK